MKRLFWIIYLIPFILIGCNNQISRNVEKDFEKMTIKTMIAPLKEKVTTDKEKISEVLDIVNSMDKKNECKLNILGWDMIINLEGNEKKDIYIVGNFIQIDEYAYEQKPKLIEKLKNAYNSLPSKEEFSEVDRELLVNQVDRENSNLNIIVSNQSFIPEVKMSVYLNKSPYIDNKFQEGIQHTLINHYFEVSEGKQVVVTVAEGGTAASK